MIVVVVNASASIVIKSTLHHYDMHEIFFRFSSSTVTKKINKTDTPSVSAHFRQRTHATTDKRARVQQATQARARAVVMTENENIFFYLM